MFLAKCGLSGECLCPCKFIENVWCDSVWRKSFWIESSSCIYSWVQGWSSPPTLCPSGLVWVGMLRWTCVCRKAGDIYGMRHGVIDAHCSWEWRQLANHLFYYGSTQKQTRQRCVRYFAAYLFNVVVNFRCLPWNEMTKMVSPKWNFLYSLTWWVSV